MELFGWLSALFFTICYIPQIVRTHRLKTVDDISIALFVLNGIAYICGFIYGTWLDKWALIANYSAGFLLTSVIIMQWIIYKDYRKDDIRAIVRKELKNIKRRLK